MSDFLSNLVARQLGTDAPVRPRLAARFEPPPDAFAHDAALHAASFDDSDADPRELVFEMEARPTLTRDDSAAHDDPEPARAQTTRRETGDTLTPLVIFREPHAREHSSVAHDTPTPARVAEPRTQTRAREENEPVEHRPVSLHPSSSSNDEVTRPERRTPPAPEPRETPRPFVGDDATPRHAPDAEPTPTRAPVRRDADNTQRASDTHSTPKRVEPARTRETSRAREDEKDETRAERRERRERKDVPALVPRQPRPRRDARRDAAARDEAGPRAEVTPTINVTIGRVEVRATQAAPASPRRANAAAPRMGLDEYLRRRNGEVRE